jgi:tRNA threonylcarbamoyl adenosine modification protein YeaZ
MKLLAIETATDACSVALQSGESLAERFSSEPRIHAALVLEMVYECLRESALELPDLDVLVFGCGPGSFTGVRIATAVTQGLAFGADIPVVPVSTLAGHAVSCWRQTGATRIAVAVDARMDEARVQDGRSSRLSARPWRGLSTESNPQFCPWRATSWPRVADCFLTAGACRRTRRYPFTCGSRLPGKAAGRAGRHQSATNP